MAAANLPLNIVLPLVVATAMVMVAGLGWLVEPRLRHIPFGLALLCGLAAIVVDSHVLAAGLAAVWLLATLVIAARGTARIMALGLRPLHELAQSFAMVYLTVGAMWLVAWRAGWTVMGFPPVWGALTAAHFHCAGCGLLLAISLLARHRPSRCIHAAAVLAIVAIPLTAIGIAASRPLERGAALITVGAGLLYGIAALRGAGLSGLRQGALRASGITALATMSLAASYAIGSAASLTPITLGPWSAIETMIITHGVGNAVLLLGGAWLAWRGMTTAQTTAEAPPFSRFTGSGAIAGDFFARADALESERVAYGLIDSLDDVQSPELNRAAVHSDVVAFYQRTAAHTLIVTPRWQPGFVLGGRIWSRIARRLQQLQLPTEAQHPRPVASAIVALQANRDGRHLPRAWIRTYPDGQALYVAAYATHTAGDRRFMNIAFPLPWSNLTSVLHMRSREDNAVEVTTRLPAHPYAAGIWLVLRLGRWHLPLRLPMHEAICLWPAGHPAIPNDFTVQPGVLATCVARHKLHLCGIHYLTLDYTISRTALPALPLLPTPTLGTQTTPSA